MKFRALPSALEETAQAASDFFKREFGLTGFHVEEPIDPDVSGRPTLSVATKEYEIVCVEVSETPYPTDLNQFILDCKIRGLPVKLYVAIPRGVEDPDYRTNAARARVAGVGIVEVDGRGGTLLSDALSLSLTGHRPIDKGKFPARYRPALVTAESTFRGGSPVKGCAVLYDEIEQLTRSAARKTLERSLWTKSTPAGHTPGINLQTGPWRDVLTLMLTHVDFKRCGCPKLTTDLLTRVLAIVPYRNESGHKPRSRLDRIRRDAQLRTRFETATDILEDLVDASRVLRL